MSADNVTVGVSGRHPGGRSRVDDVMRPATSTVEGTAHLAAAAYLMKHRGDTALVVITDDADRRPIALITDADITQAVADGRAMDCTRISDLGLAPPLSVELGTSARDAAGLLLSRHIHHLPVLEGGTVRPSSTGAVHRAGRPGQGVFGGRRAHPPSRSHRIVDQKASVADRQSEWI